MQKHKNPFKKTDTEHVLFFYRTTPPQETADVSSKQLQFYRVYSFLTMCRKINTLPVWKQTGWESDSKR